MCKDHAIAKFAFVTFKLTSVSAYTTLSLLLLGLWFMVCGDPTTKTTYDGVVVLR